MFEFNHVTVHLDTGKADAGAAENIEQFLQLMSAQLLDTFFSRPIKSGTIEQINGLLALCWREFTQRTGGPYVIAPGCQVVELKGHILGHHLSFAWETAWVDGEPYSVRCNHVPLGYYEDAMLYIAFQDPLPPTLVARWGEGAEYTTHNVFLQGPPPADAPAAIREAYKIAQAVNAFVGTECAVPPYHGNIGMPVLLDLSKNITAKWTYL